MFDIDPSHKDGFCGMTNGDVETALSFQYWMGALIGSFGATCILVGSYFAFLYKSCSPWMMMN